MQQTFLLPCPARLAPFLSVCQTSAVLFLGFMAVCWIAEEVQHRGLGDGYALLICTSIASSAPFG